jgi:hypothetical protein
MDKETKKDIEGIKKYFKKPEVIEKVTAIAIQFKEVFGFDWFTFNQCATVFSKDSDISQMVDIIRSLELCGFIIVDNRKELERFRLGKKQFKVLKHEFEKRSNL